MTVVAAALLFGAVTVAGAVQLAALKMWLAFKSASFVNAPIAKLAARIDELEAKLLATAMSRR